MGVTPARDPGPGKTDGGVGKTETNKSKPKKGKIIRLVPPGKEAAPQECDGSWTILNHPWSSLIIPHHPSPSLLIRVYVKTKHESKY
jgi:hypothetical protein